MVNKKGCTVESNHYKALAQCFKRVSLLGKVCEDECAFLR